MGSDRLLTAGHTWAGGVLGLGFWDTPTARVARCRVFESRSQNAPLPMCVRGPPPHLCNKIRLTFIFY